MSQAGEFLSENIWRNRTKAGNAVCKGSEMKTKIGDKLVEIEDGVIKATTEEIRHPDGRIDVIVHIPCLQIMAKNEKG